MVKNPKTILWGSLFLAWCFDFLFWNKSPGVSFCILIVIVLSAGMIFARKERLNPSRRSLWLILPILLFASGTFFRKEPLTTTANYLSTLTVLGIFAHTFKGGRWLDYSFGDYVVAFFSLVLSALYNPVMALKKKPSSSNDNGTEVKTTKSLWKNSLPYLRGVVIAIPVMILFASLLASADMVFEEYLKNYLAVFSIENFPEYIFRGVYILILGYLLTGIYLHAYTNEKEVTLIGEDKPLIPKFLGFTEAVIVLGCVEVLFILFISIQFRYFFGGEINIDLDGFTYSEYARRGFGELIIVSILSLLLFLSLSSITKRGNKPQKIVFSLLGILLVIFLGVILVSAYQRLLLYEHAYGFTRLRTYAHLFMIWSGILLLLVVILEIFRKQRAFALAFLLSTLGFVLSLNIINVDGLIVNQNVTHSVILATGETSVINNRQESLDSTYLYSLSSDAVPALITAVKEPHLSLAVKEELAGILACHRVRIEEKKVMSSWQSIHFSDIRAEQLLDRNREYFQAVEPYLKDGSWWVDVNDNKHPCEIGYRGFD